MVRLWWRMTRVFVIVLSSLPLAVSAEESISVFKGSAILTAERRLEVTEEIMYDFGDTPRGGIQRLLPTISFTGDRFLSSQIDAIQVERDGVRIPFQQQQTREHVVLLLGDPQESLQGIHTYVLSYEVSLLGVDWPDRQEFFWPVTGDGWSVPIKHVSFALLAPGAIQSVSCTTGQGVAASTDCITQIEDSYAMVQMSRQLTAQEPLYITITLPPATLPVVTWWQRFQRDFQDYPYLVIPFLTFVGMFLAWWLRGRDPIERRTLRPAYTVPRALQPGVLGAMYRQDVLPASMMATCLDLAKRGYILLTCDGDFQTDTVIWKITRTTKRLASDLLGYERRFLEGVLLPGQSLTLSAEEQGSRKEVFQGVSQALLQELVRRRWLVTDPQRTRLRWLLGAVTVGVFSGIFFLLRNPPYFWVGLASATIIAAFGWFMPRTTQVGADIVHEIAEFRLFLQAHLQERENFTQGPPRTVEQFVKFLPEAFALDVQKRWAKQFEGMIITMPPYLQSSITLWSSATFVHAFEHFQHDLVRYLFLAAHESIAPFLPEQENPPE